MNMKYGIKAYGKWQEFATKKEYKEYLMDWIAGTEGAERERERFKPSSILVQELNGQTQTANNKEIKMKKKNLHRLGVV